MEEVRERRRSVKKREGVKGRLEYSRGVMSNEWQGIHFDLPADNLSIELTRSLQSNLVLTPLYALTHLTG